MAFKKIDDTIYCMSAGANAYLLRGACDILVDAGDPAHAGALIASLREIGALDRLWLIFLTHAHHDHCGAAAQIRALTGAKIAVYGDDAMPLEQGINADLEPFGLLGRMASGVANHEPGGWGCVADVLLDDSRDLSEHGITCRAIPLPGHTRGSGGLLYNRSLFCGDLVMGAGRFAISPLFLYKESEWLKSLGRAAASADVLYQGHGKPGMKARSMRRLVRKHAAEVQP